MVHSASSAYFADVAYFLRFLLGFAIFFRPPTSFQLFSKHFEPQLPDVLDGGFRNPDAISLGSCSEQPDSKCLFERYFSNT